jgi:arginine decarboxylase
VHVRVEDYGYSVSNVIKGDAITDVLRYLQYDPETMIERVRKQAERALRNGQITLPQVRLLMRHYEDSLDAYTYLGDDDE